MLIRLVVRESSALILGLTGDEIGSIIANPEALQELAKRIGDEVSASIRDRCYSLVQSIAECGVPVGGADLQKWADTIQNEAFDIASDAAWIAEGR